VEEKLQITAWLPADLVEEFHLAVQRAGLNRRERWVAVGAALRLFIDAPAKRKARALLEMRTHAIRSALEGTDWESIAQGLIPREDEACDEEWEEEEEEWEEDEE
jgi:hypothetical protein